MGEYGALGGLKTTVGGKLLLRRLLVELFEVFELLFAIGL